MDGGATFPNVFGSIESAPSGLETIRFATSTLRKSLPVARTPTRSEKGSTAYQSLIHLEAQLTSASQQI